MRAKSTLSSLLIRPTSSGLRSCLLTRRLILSRGCTWPVPIDRDDDAYFAPLESLLLHEGMELYLGLIHREDGAARRIETAKRHVAQFGVATECGFGRAPENEIEPLLRTHGAVSSAW
jgi:hypothetical protein